MNHWHLSLVVMRTRPGRRAPRALSARYGGIPAQRRLTRAAREVLLPPIRGQRVADLACDRAFTRRAERVRRTGLWLLLEVARELDIPGRSRMKREQLVEAVADARRKAKRAS